MRLDTYSSGKKARKSKMKRIELLQCEICGTQYKLKREAEECEKSHIRPLTIENCRYMPKNMVDNGYPVTIDVQFKDGITIRYRR